jgi:hypothetical protein
MRARELKTSRLASSRVVRWLPSDLIAMALTIPSVTLRKEVKHARRKLSC